MLLYLLLIVPALLGSLVTGTVVTNYMLYPQVVRLEFVNKKTVECYWLSWFVRCLVEPAYFVLSLV